MTLFLNTVSQSSEIPLRHAAGRGRHFAAETAALPGAFADFGGEFGLDPAKFAYVRIFSLILAYFRLFSLYSKKIYPAWPEKFK